MMTARRSLCLLAGSANTIDFKLVTPWPKAETLGDIGDELLDQRIVVDVDHFAAPQTTQVMVMR